MSKISNLIFHNKRHYITQKFSNKHKAVDYGTYRKKIKQYLIFYCSICIGGFHEPF